jgi:hypothetical protein
LNDGVKRQILNTVVAIDQVTEGYEMCILRNVQHGFTKIERTESTRFRRRTMYVQTFQV